MFWIWTIIKLSVFAAAPLAWLILSIKIVRPEEMAIKALLGKPVSFCDSGFRFVPFFFGCYLARYPKTIYNLDYTAREVISKAGQYEEENYGAQVLKVDAVVYLSFPKDKRYLIKILQAQVPIKKEDLVNWTEEAVVGALRAVFGRMTWRESVEGITKVTKETEDLFKGVDGALLTAGFKAADLKLTIKEIKLPRELEDALPGVDRARLEAEAAPFEAQQKAGETIGAMIQMMAISTGEKLEDIQAQIQKSSRLKKEFRGFCQDLICRRMAIDGNSYLDIRVTGVEGTEKGLLELLAAWKRMPMGKEKGEKTEAIEEKKKEEEIQKAVEEVNQGI